VKIQLIRHATLLLTIGGKLILVDPMLSKAGTMAAVPDVANPAPNPLVDLPLDPASLKNVDAILITHTHRDHFDDTALQILPCDRQIFCQPEDKGKMAETGFTQVQAVEEAVVWEGITIYRTKGQHGIGSIGEKMGPVSGFVLQDRGEPSLYIAGDTIWCSEVQVALEKYQPQIIVCFAGAAQFGSGGPITMDKEDIYNVCKQSPAAQVVVVHMEAWNHCALSRKELQAFIQKESLTEQVYIPADGEWMNF